MLFDVQFLPRRVWSALSWNFMQYPVPVDLAGICTDVGL